VYLCKVNENEKIMNDFMNRFLDSDAPYLIALGLVVLGLAGLIFALCCGASIAFIVTSGVTMFVGGLIGGIMVSNQ
jgi:hypothetical protein